MYSYGFDLAGSFRSAVLYHRVEEGAAAFLEVDVADPPDVGIQQITGLYERKKYGEIEPQALGLLASSLEWPYIDEATIHFIRGLAFTELGSFEDAVDCFSTSFSLCLLARSPESAADSLMNRAICRQYLGDDKRALADLDEALVLFRTYRSDAETAICIMNRGNCLLNLGDFQNALSAYDETLPIIELHDMAENAAIIRSNQAVCLLLAGYPRDALELILNVLPTLYRLDLIQEAARGLKTQANCLHELGELSEALPFYNASHLLTGTYGAPIDMARLFLDRAGCLADLGHHEEALLAYEDALFLLRDYGPPSELATGYMNKARCLVELGMLDRAVTGYEDALGILFVFGTPLATAHCYSSQASCFQALGYRKRALDSHDQALDLYGDHGTPLDQARCIMNRANTLDTMQRYSEALHAYEDALSLYVQHGSAVDQARCKMNKAICLRNAGSTERALEEYLDVIESLETVTLHDSLLSSLHENIARIHDDCGNHEAALDSMMLAAQLSEPLSAARRELQYRLGKRSELADRYRFIVRTAIALHQNVTAFTFIQHGKGRVLLDLIERRSRISELDNQETTARKQYSREEIDLATLNSTVAIISQRRQEERKSLLGNAMPHSLDSIVSKLRPAEGLVDTFELDNGTLALVLLLPHQDSCPLVEVIDMEALDALHREWQSARQAWLTATAAHAAQRKKSKGATQTPRRADIDAAKHREEDALRKLGHLILNPLISELTRHDVRSLVISPDGILSQIPFAALMIPGTDTPLIDRFSLQLIPTASALATLRVRGELLKTWPATCLAAAPLGTSLRHSESEVTMIAQLMHEAAPAAPPPVTLFSKATRDEIISRLSGVQIFHLATHGLYIPDEETFLSYRILLAKNSSISIADIYDGAIPLASVFMVCLSSCHLGEVVIHGAEAIGFSHAFIQAGAQVVLAPIWAVNDLATRIHMTSWYRRLLSDDRPPVAEAWQQATKDLRSHEQFAHPYYWGGFLPTGDGALRLANQTDRA